MEDILTEEDFLFLRELANEIKTQDKFCTSGPVIYQIRETKKVFGMDMAYADNKVIIFPHSDYASFESEDEAKAHIIECLLDDGDMDESELEAKKLEVGELDDFDEIEEYCNEKLHSECYTTGVADDEKKSGFFLTMRALKKHLSENSHHYNNTAISYCDAAGWRNPEMVRLMQIIEKFADK